MIDIELEIFSPQLDSCISQTISSYTDLINCINSIPMRDGLFCDMYIDMYNDSFKEISFEFKGINNFNDMILFAKECWNTLDSFKKFLQ